MDVLASPSPSQLIRDRLLATVLCRDDNAKWHGVSLKEYQKDRRKQVQKPKQPQLSLGTLPDLSIWICSLENVSSSWRYRLDVSRPQISDDNLENEVCAILKSEEQREDSEFEVKVEKYVRAEVKVVKCLMQNIAVDISVNQIGGLLTLEFLEKVNETIGKDCLFRRCIMLIKAWCCYESCILGAHHGSISTYALETLVLYIFHIFHKSLDSPLAVLYRFLDYYSKFDWDNKGISLFGPVSLSLLPELVVESPDIRDDGFLPWEDNLKKHVEAYTVPPRNLKDNPQVFSRKFLNIVDPLRQSNNLGRSVNRDNFKRIRKEFDVGARILGKILQAPAGFADSVINQFFKKTLKMDRAGLRSDA